MKLERLKPRKNSLFWINSV